MSVPIITHEPGGWIPCAQALPPDNCEVFVRVSMPQVQGMGFGIGILLEGKWRTAELNPLTWSGTEVTHWKPVW